MLREYIYKCVWVCLAQHVCLGFSHQYCDEVMVILVLPLSRFIWCVVFLSLPLALSNFV